jgi:2-oxoglutarate dehydrogenase E1 component
MKEKMSDKDLKIRQFGFNSDFIEDLYEQYLKDPSTVSESWQRFFAEYERDFQVGDSGATGEAKKPEVRSQKPERENLSIVPRPSSTGEAKVLRGVMAKIAENMEASLTLPTATSVRVIPVKVMEENRRIINQHLSLIGQGKASYTHIIAWAMVKALKDYPNMNSAFTILNGEPHKIQRTEVNLGLAIDVEQKDGSRILLVPNIKNAHKLNFLEFLKAYNDLIQRARSGKLTFQDFQDTTISLTNPGTIGTVASIPRLMPGQGAIIATGVIDYPAEYQGMSEETLSQLGVSKVMTITSTYDHRIIQGAESGSYLARIHQLLQGEDGFYEQIFTDLKLPHEPIHWERDENKGLLDSTRNFEVIEKQARVLQLINAYRVRGHLLADLDPLGYEPHYHPELDPAQYGLTIWDLDRKFITGGLGGQSVATLRDILDTLRETYCGKIGVEYRNIQNPEQKLWLQERMESCRNKTQLSREAKRRILLRLNAAEAFEKFLHTRYVGYKRFSLEGAETLIPMLDTLLEEAAEQGVVEIVMGMAHRGRLNVLANIIGKSYEKIFSEFEGYIDPTTPQGSGDVKYHLGATGFYESPTGKKINLSLASNPSHLEAVNPVVEGMARAKQERIGDINRKKVIPVLIHGDAAFAGQGIVAETLNLSQLRGYRTGGTVHIVINNQIGFTTSPEQARSTLYATDIAKMLQVPIFHVNGDDPEAAIHVVKLAFAYRQKFATDVVIDLICYRRHGHSEVDEPSYTHPVLYKKIQEHPSVRQIYTEQLLRNNELKPEEAEEMAADFRKRFEQALEVVKSLQPTTIPSPSKNPLIDLARPKLKELSDTGVEKERLLLITDRITTLPSDFKLHPKLHSFLEKRRAILTDPRAPIDWAFAEALAFGSLLTEGIHIRLSGEDSARGTFSQRHAILYDYETEKEYIPLNHLEPTQAKFDVFDSLLSEAAVLGFEYGYSVADPSTLVLWEAQFGDFANGAQVIIDQFLVSSEEKWGQSSDIVLLLPHGYEGQGPEHSSARLERFLQLCAENNIQVCNCTTPAQYFHLLRRQVYDGTCKPLVLATPKSLLRHPLAVSTLEEMIKGHFQEILDDRSLNSKESVTRVILCNGKIYYELFQERENRKIPHMALIRLEQLYPFPEAQLQELLRTYPNLQELFWVQEEPQNMGAWSYIYPRLRTLLQKDLSFFPKLLEAEPIYVGRPESASPATGSLKIHQEEQREIIETALKE